MIKRKMAQYITHFEEKKIVTNRFTNHVHYQSTKKKIGPCGHASPFTHLLTALQPLPHSRRLSSHCLTQGGYIHGGRFRRIIIIMKTL